MRTFNKDSVVCFLGDSITANGGWIRRIYEHYRQEGIPCKLFNCGVSGDTANRAMFRLEETVFCYKPSEVVVAFGMNDCGYLQYKEEPLTDAGIMNRRRALDNCVASLRAIANHCAQREVGVTFCTPTLPDELTESVSPKHPGVAAALLELSLRIRALGEELGVEVIDFSHPFREMGRKLYKEGKTMIGTDRVHPLQVGHEFMARQFLKGQGFDISIPETWEELESLAAVSHDAWEEKRYQLELKANAVMFAEWNFGFGKKAPEAMEQAIARRLKTEENVYIRHQLEIYAANWEEIPQRRQELIDYTMKG